VVISDATGNFIGLGPGKGNTISANSAIGVEIFGLKAKGNTVTGNTIDANVFKPDPKSSGTGVGVYIEQSTDNLVANNPSISGNGQVGVYLFNVIPRGTATPDLVQQNTIARNGQYGVFLYNSAGNYYSIIQTGPNANTFSGNAIANVREFTGAPPQTTTVSLSRTAVAGLSPSAAPTRRVRLPRNRLFQ
jgi:hypothetical protein